MEEEDKDLSEPGCVHIPRSSTNNKLEQNTGGLPPDQSCAAAIYEPLTNTNAINSIMNAEAEKGACDK